MTSSLDNLAIFLATDANWPVIAGAADLGTGFRFAVPAFGMGVPYSEDVALVADTDLDVGVFAEPARSPDSFFAFSRDISASRTINLRSAFSLYLVVEEIEDGTI